MNSGPGQSNIKTVLELDLAAYSDVASALEEHLDVQAVKTFQDQIQSFVDEGLNQLGLRREEVVFATAGDNALLIFDSPAVVHQFAKIVQEATIRHNRKKSVESAKRWFRMGAATGAVLVIAEERRIVGTTVARAVRLEAAAEKGELLIDTETYDALPDEIKKLYGEEEVVAGKRDERFTVRRCALVSPADRLGKAIALPKPNESGKSANESNKAKPPTNEADSQVIQSPPAKPKAVGVTKQIFFAGPISVVMVLVTLVLIALSLWFLESLFSPLDARETPLQRQHVSWLFLAGVDMVSGVLVFCFYVRKKILASFTRGHKKAVVCILCLFMLSSLYILQRIYLCQSAARGFRYYFGISGPGGVAIMCLLGGFIFLCFVFLLYLFLRKKNGQADLPPEIFNTSWKKLISSPLFIVLAVLGCLAWYASLPKHGWPTAKLDNLGGVAVSDLNESERLRLGVPSGVQGEEVTMATNVKINTNLCSVGFADLRQDDIIMSINGSAAIDADEAARLCNAYRGDSISLGVWRPSVGHTAGGGLMFLQIEVYNAGLNR